MSVVDRTYAMIPGCTSSLYRMHDTYMAFHALSPCVSAALYIFTDKQPQLYVRSTYSKVNSQARYPRLECGVCTRLVSLRVRMLPMTTMTTAQSAEFHEQSNQAINQTIYISCFWDSSGESIDNNWESSNLTHGACLAPHFV